MQTRRSIIRLARLRRAIPAALVLVPLLMSTPMASSAARAVDSATRPARAPGREFEAEFAAGSGFEPEYLEHLRESASLHPTPGGVTRVPRLAARGDAIELGPDNLLVNAKDGDPFASAQEEPSIASFGINSVCAFNTDKFIFGGDGIAAAYQSGPGGPWLPAPLPPAPGFAPAWLADPVVMVNPKLFTFYFCGLFTPTGSPSFDGIAVSHAILGPGPAMGGVPWSPPIVARIGTPGSVLLDKPWLAADSSSSNLYLCYTSFGSGTDSIQCQKSSDGGMTWSSPVTLATASPALLQGSRVAVGPAGEVYVAWFRAAGPPDSMFVAKSVDHGATFGPRKLVAAVYSNFGSSGPGSNLGYAPNFPSLAVDRSFGDHRGRVYVAWAEAENYTTTPMGTGGALTDVSASGSIATATPFTPGMVLRGMLVGSDTDTWSFTGETGKTYSFLVDSTAAAFGALLEVMTPDTMMVLAFSTVPTGIGSGKPNLTLFTATCPGIYFAKLIHSSMGGGGYRMKTGVTGPSPLDPTKALDQRDVRVSWSDGGTAWSAPVRANLDPPTSDQVMPEIGVSLEGYVYAMWLDGNVSELPCDGATHVTTARSEFGGMAWVPGGLHVTSTPTAWWMTASDLKPNQGDYLGLSVGEQISYAWPDGRLGDPDIFAANAHLMPAYTCVPDSAWSPGSSHTLSYTIFNPNPLFTNVYAWSLAAARGWPGMPASTVAVSPAASTTVSATFTVPDTAAAGTVPVTFAFGPSNGAFHVSCPSVDTVHTTPVAVGPEESVAAPGLALTRAWPNPAHGALSLAFSLPADAPARIVLIDVAGRRVLERAIGAAGPGRHTLTFGHELMALPAGVYAVRLEQNARVAFGRVAIVR